MWFDDINKKILEGENSNHSNHPEKAWNEMESLLNKHLPQEKKRRRFIFFLLFPVLLGAGLATFYFLHKTNRPDRSTITVQENISARTSTPASTLPVEQKIPAPASPGETETDLEKQPGQTGLQYQPATANVAELNPQKPVVSKQVQSPIAKYARKSRQKQLEAEPDQKQADAIAGNQEKSENSNKNELAKERVQKELPVTKGLPVPNISNTQPVDEDSIGKATEIIAEEKKPGDSTANDIAEKVEPTKKTKTSFGDKFSLNLSLGPDISAVGIDKPGRVQFQYGIGVAYAINKNLVVRTGFYAGDKKYDADSADYHMPYPINKLEKVEADCYVYEIPLSLAYHFNQVKKHNWFISGGVSSYIMKRETYGYYYKNTWGQPQYYDRTYKNENTHLFSVIGLSGGYQYHLSHRISFLTEPYIKFPVGGIGVGKVRLNNTGILFTVGYKPFSKN